MRRLSLVALLLILAAPPAWAHGSHGTHTIDAAVIVTFADHHDGAASGWSYTVTAPDGDEPWARGSCDALGRVVFVPDQAGNWTVRVFAADGHGGELVVPVGADFLEGAHDHGHDEPPSGSSRNRNMVMIVAILFGVFGLVKLFMSRQA